MKARKAQATSVATFVFILAIFMLMYVLLLPEEQREQIMDIKDTSEEGDEELAGQTNLLYTSPGNVYTYERNELNIPINSVSLYAKTEEDIKELATKITVSKSWFSDKTETLTFQTDSKDELEKMQLYFFVNSGEGTIYIKFNGYTVFEGEINSADSPITLPVDRAKSVNVLNIGMVSGDFAGDKYTLSSVSVKQNRKSEKNSETRLFYLTPGERAGLKKSKLTYFINCLKIDPKEQGDMTLLLNSKELFVQHVFCDAGTQVQTLSTSYFTGGRNTLEFKIDKGEYSVEGIEIEMETKEKYYPQYTFELSSEQYDKVADEEKEVNVLFKFKNDKDYKKATITVNENQINLDTRKDSYEWDISTYLERGTNYVKIMPKVDFEISSLKVYITDKESEE
ncbi:MAG: hypothetical protein Q8O03_05195 [Nanoarchaeota archaeon]|nr:hypothetical protein [Nanoarchaeota archaeon]